MKQAELQQTSFLSSKLKQRMNSISNIKTLDSTIIAQMAPIHSQSHLEKVLMLKPLDLNIIKAEKAAFGTKARRQLTQMNSKSYCSMLNYSNVNFFQDKQGRIQNASYVNKHKPFISSTNRFNQKIQKLPGPGNYQAKYQFDKYSLNNQNKSLPILCPIKRHNLTQNSTEKNRFWNNSQQYQYLKQNIRNSQAEVDKTYVRQKVKQKFREQRRKLLQFKKMYKNKQKTIFKPMLRKSIVSQQKKPQPHKEKPKNQNYMFRKAGQNDKINLKQLTNKYLPKTQYKFQSQERSSFAHNKFSYDRVFIQTKNKPYQSYIVHNQNPGPGTYQLRKFR